MLYLNLDKYPFNLLPVRLAINRQQLSKTGETGSESPANPSGIVLPAFQKYLSSDFANSSFTVDTNQANQLLQRAGFTKGSDGIYAAKNGKKLSLSMNVVRAFTDWITDCQIMAGELKEIGPPCKTALISVTLRAKGGPMRLGSLHSPGWFPVAVQALVVLAETDKPCSSSAMAQDLKAHAVFLRRVLAQLVRANLIQAREGRDGGYRLARLAEHITLAEVYQAVNVVDPAEHPAGTSGVNARVQTVLDEIGAEAEQRLLEILGRSTLASVLERIATAGRPS